MASHITAYKFLLGLIPGISLISNSPTHPSLIYFAFGLFAILCAYLAGACLTCCFHDGKGFPYVVSSTSLSGLIKCHPLRKAFLLRVNGQPQSPKTFWLFLLLIFCITLNHLIFTLFFFLSISFHYIVNIFNPFLSLTLRREAGTTEVLNK